MHDQGRLVDDHSGATARTAVAHAWVALIRAQAQNVAARRRRSQRGEATRGNRD